MVRDGGRQGSAQQCGAVAPIFADVEEAAPCDRPFSEDCKSIGEYLMERGECGGMVLCERVEVSGYCREVPLKLPFLCADPCDFLIETGVALAMLNGCCHDMRVGSPCVLLQHDKAHRVEGRRAGAFRRCPATDVIEPEGSGGGRDQSIMCTLFCQQYFGVYGEDWVTKVCSDSGYLMSALPPPGRSKFTHSHHKEMEGACARTTYVCMGAPSEAMLDRVNELAHRELHVAVGTLGRAGSIESSDASVTPRSCRRELVMSVG